MINDLEKMMPALRFLIGTDNVCLWATDNEKYVYFEDHANLDTGVQVGSMLKPGDTALESMRTGASIHRIVPKEVFGKELRTYVVPVSGGCLGVTLEEEERTHILEAIQVLQRSNSDILTDVNNLSDALNGLKEQLTEVSSYAVETQSFHDQLKDIISTTLHIVDELQLLSLNSLLEASKAGVEGRTFTVVADEIKKLAAVGQAQVKEIESLLQFIVQALDEMQGSVSTMHTYSEELINGSVTMEQKSFEVAVTVNDLNAVTHRLR